MEEEEIDRISQLPDEVLIRILSLVPSKEVARAKLVSKSWQNLFEFSPSFTFDYLPRTFEFLPPRSPPPGDITDDVTSFVNAVDSALKLHKHLTLDKLKLCVDLDLIGSGTTSLMIDSWIDAALARKVGHLDLWFLSRGKDVDHLYLLPVKVFSARTITDLRLHGCRLEISGDIHLPLLRKLCLRIQCDEEAIQKLISSCPLIQDLKTIFCSGMQWLHVSGLPNLQRLSVVNCDELESIEIDAPSLQYFHYHLIKGVSPCDIVFTSSSEFLKELILFDDRYVTEDFFQSLLFRFPNLELLIVLCSLQRIEISHHRLRRLDLRPIRADAILKFDTPNLQSLRYAGNKMPLISAISSLNTSSLRKVDINFFKLNVRSHFSILQWKEFFEKIRHCQDMKLHLHINSKLVYVHSSHLLLYLFLKILFMINFLFLVVLLKQLMIPGKLRSILSPPVYDIKQLYVTVDNCRGYPFIIDRMLWVCHPQTLSISPWTAPRFLKVLSKISSSMLAYLNPKFPCISQNKVLVLQRQNLFEQN